MTAFLYALPEHVTLQKEASVARGLRSLFPDIEIEARDGAFLTGDIVPIAGQVGDNSNGVENLPRLLVLEVKTAFAGLLVEALSAS